MLRSCFMLFYCAEKLALELENICPCQIIHPILWEGVGGEGEEQGRKAIKSGRWFHLTAHNFREEINLIYI